MYQAISEIIKFVFKLKGITINKKADGARAQPGANI
jgi:hypothetical protein